MKKLLLFVFFCLGVGLSAVGQTTSPIQIPDYKQMLIDPQATLMNMYGDYPVDLANGLVDISIPLCEVSTPWLSFPINAKFHASGLRADEQEGLLGVRWLIDATYSITRSVRGYPDDQMVAIPPPYCPFDNRVGDPGYTPDFATLWGTTYIEGAGRQQLSGSVLQELSNYSGPEGSWRDTEYDIFSYHLPSGKSGKFILYDDMGVKTARTLPYEPIKIEVHRYNQTTTGHFDRFTITDENGVMYKYEQINTTDSNYILEWKLKEIVSPDRRDSIVFEYDVFLNRRMLPWMIATQSVMDFYEGTYVNFGPADEGPMEDFFEDELGNPNVQYITPSFSLMQDKHDLSAIRFKGGRVEFTYGSVGNNKYLTSLKVLNSVSNAMKEITFSYVLPYLSSTSDPNKKPALLNKLTIVDPMTNMPNGGEYQFEYYNTDRYPAIGYSGIEMQSDWWGYYLRGGDNLISDEVTYRHGVLHWRDNAPYASLERSTIGSTVLDKNSNVEDMKTGMLKSIVYPTKGKTVFHYESNRYRNRNGVSTPCGGLRIQKIENISNNGISEFKTYTYNPQTGGYGTMPSYLYPPDPRGGSKNFLTETIVTNEYRWYASSSTYAQYITFDYSGYLYSNTLPAQFLTFTSNTVYYDKVVEYWGAETANNGYTEHEYSITMPQIESYNHNFPANRMNEYNSRQFIHVIPPAYGENPTQLRKKTVYDKNNQPMEESLYEYTKYEKGSVYDMPIQRLWFYKLEGPYYGWVDHPERHAAIIAAEELIRTDYTDYQQFAWLNQEYRLGASRLAKETVKHYTANGVVTTIKSFEYDPTYLLPVKEAIALSGVESVYTTYKYPHHYTTQPYTGMVQRNILSPVIEQAAYKNISYSGSELLEKGITNYRLWGTNHYAPQNFQYQRQGSALETRLVYDYNLQNGNLQATIKDGARKVVYIRNAYGQPVAVIDQADYSQVNSLLGSTRIQNIANSFIVSSADMTALNNLRTSLPNAMVTTYTYKPLVGIETITDPSGRKTTYEYDTHGRLIYIKDENSHILEKYEYNYKN